MMMHIRAFCLSLGLLAAMFGTAGAADWVVSKVNPPAQYSVDSATWHALSVGTAVPDGSWVRTGERGILLLEKDAGSILFKPGSLAEIANEFEGRPGTSIRQRSGALLLDVRTRDRAHTEVQTPFLAAVVKGTKFESRVGRWDAELEVQHGIVEVTHIRRGERIDLVAGQTARIGESAALPIAFFGSSAKPRTDWVNAGEPVVLPLSSREAARGWDSNTSEQALRLLGGISKSAIGIAMATLGALVLGMLMMRRKLAALRGVTGQLEASSSDAPKESRVLSLADNGRSFTNILVAVFSACIVGLVAMAMPRFSLAAVVAAMALTLFVLLLIFWRMPSGKGS